MKFLFLQSLRLASQATSLYTREAHYSPTVHLKGVTHYTLQGKACEKEYEQMPVLLLFFRQVKPALWKAPLSVLFLLWKKPDEGAVALVYEGAGADDEEGILRAKGLCKGLYGA